MNIADAIAVLNKEVPHPSESLSDEVFYYISKPTPLLNVYLLIKDEKGASFYRGEGVISFQFYTNAFSLVRLFCKKRTFYREQRLSYVA